MMLARKALPALIVAPLLGAGVAHAFEAGTTITPTRADLSVDYRSTLRLSPTLTGKVSARQPARFQATATVLIGGAIGTSDLKPLLRLKTVTGHAEPTPSPLRLRTSLAQRRTIRAAERRLHRRAVLGVRLTGTFDAGARAAPHYRQFVIH